MISREKLKIMTPLQKLHKNVGDLGKLIVATGFEKLPKVQSGHTNHNTRRDVASFLSSACPNFYDGFCRPNVVSIFYSVRVGWTFCLLPASRLRA